MVRRDLALRSRRRRTLVLHTRRDSMNERSRRSPARSLKPTMGQRPGTRSRTLQVRPPHRRPQDIHWSTQPLIQDRRALRPRHRKIALTRARVRFEYCQIPMALMLWSTTVRNSRPLMRRKEALRSSTCETSYPLTKRRKRFLPLGPPSPLRTKLLARSSLPRLGIVRKAARLRLDRRACVPSCVSQSGSRCKCTKSTRF